MKHTASTPHAILWDWTRVAHSMFEGALILVFGTLFWWTIVRDLEFQDFTQ